MYYIQTTANTGYIYLQLTGQTDWKGWEITYGLDVHYDVKDSKAELIDICDLPDGIKDDFDFQRSMQPHIRKVYKIA